MTVHADILKELLIAGYEGAHLHAAFERLCASLARHGVGAASIMQKMPTTPVAVSAAPMVRGAKSAKVKTVDRRQLNMMLASDGGQAKAAPLSAAERQARARARRKNVTQLMSHSGQVIENIEESRNVTAARDSSAQVVDPVEKSAVVPRDGGVTREKKRFPQTPLRKNNPPLAPQRDGTVSIAWSDPLMPFCQEVAGTRYGQFSETLTFKRSVVERAALLMAERGVGPPLAATG